MNFVVICSYYFIIVKFWPSGFWSSQSDIFSADADVRLARRIRRDTVEKGRDIGMVLDQVSKNLY